MNATISPLIAQLNRTNLPNAASISHITPVGLDVGNGAVKMTSSIGQTLMESYVHYLPERATHANRLCRKYFLVTNEVSRSRSVKR